MLSKTESPKNDPKKSSAKGARRLRRGRCTSKLQLNAAGPKVIAPGFNPVTLV